MPAKPRHPPAPYPAPWSAAALFGLMLLAALVAYQPALHGAFLWDDDGHVTRPDLRTIDGLFRIWFEPGATQQYYPLLHSAFWLEHKLWGDAVLGYHLVNVLLHAGAATLFAVVLRRLAAPGARLAAWLFLLHPVCVESVAWISEQKNTLSLVLYLGAALAWLGFDEKRTSRGYALATGLFLLALLTKTVTASLPAALLVVGWWRRGRLDWRRDVVPLLPWFALGAASGLFTAHFERELIGARGAEFALGFADRLVLAGRVFWFYLGKLVWPADLIFMYPRWAVDAGIWWQWLFLLAGLGLLGMFAWWSRRSSGPLAAALLFGGSLFPVLGFFNVYPFLFSYVADHFSYLASLGAFALAGAGVASAIGRSGRGPALGGFAVVLALFFALTWSRSAVYRDESTLWQDTLARNPDCWMAHNNLALVLVAEDRAAEAVPHLETALRLRPDFPEALNNLAEQYVNLGRLAEAQTLTERALVLLPKYPAALNTRGRALLALGKADAAARSFADAVRLDPHFTIAWCNLGVAQINLGQATEALAQFAKATQLDPNYIPAEFFAGATLVQLRRYDEAVPHLERALVLDEDHALAHFQLALALRQLGRTQESTEHYQEAIRLDPRLAR